MQIVFVPNWRRKLGGGTVSPPLFFPFSVLSGESPARELTGRTAVPPPSPWQKSSRHSTVPAQARTALLLGHIWSNMRAYSALSGGRRNGLGARGTFTTGCYHPGRGLTVPASKKNPEGATRRGGLLVPPSSSTFRGRAVVGRPAARERTRFFWVDSSGPGAGGGASEKTWTGMLGEKTVLSPFGSSYPVGGGC